MPELEPSRTLTRIYGPRGRCPCMVQPHDAVATTALTTDPQT